MKVQVSSEIEQRIRRLSKDSGLSIEDLINDAVVSSLPKLEARFASGYSHFDIEYVFSMRGDVTAFDRRGFQVWRIEPGDRLLGLQELNKRKLQLKFESKPDLHIDIVSGPPLKR